MMSYSTTPGTAKFPLKSDVTTSFFLQIHVFKMFFQDFSYVNSASEIVVVLYMCNCELQEQVVKA